MSCLGGFVVWLRYEVTISMGFKVGVFLSVIAVNKLQLALLKPPQKANTPDYEKDYYDPVI